MISPMRARPWLIASVGLNLFLGVSWWVERRSLTDTTVVVPVFRPELDVKTNTVIRHENFTWDQIESTNYATLIKNLRDVGCPEQTIRDIVVTDVDREFDRRRATEIVSPDYEWWKADPDPALVLAAASKAKALGDERAQLLTALLGPNWEDLSDYALATRAGISLTGPILGDLPDDVKKRVLAATSQGQQKIEAYIEAQRAAGLPPDPMQVAQLRQQFLTQMVVILTPQQYEEFALRYSQGAQLLRQQTRGLNLDADDFRQLYNALSPVTGQAVYYYNGTDPELVKQQQALQVQQEAILKTTLGDELYNAYTLAQDPLYRSTAAVAEQLGAPASDLGPLYQINRATQAEFDRIRNDPNMTADEKVEALSNAHIDQAQSLQQLLGPDLFDKWIQSQSSVAK
jgi:hypothetical protein